MSHNNQLHSHICILDIGDGTEASPPPQERVIYTAPAHYEAPNWSPDGTYLLLNREGRLWRLSLTSGGDAASGEPVPVSTGAVASVNNDHGISPDGSQIVVSAGHMYLLPADGSDEPRRVTENTPSYFHGWSPDGETLAYCAQRGGVFNLYAISVRGGEEKRLTFGGGSDDGPDYSPDGKWIYFNSNRTGNGRIWRIPASGDNENHEHAEQITDEDEYEDWFPHPSPDGKWLVFLSYPQGTTGHPPEKNVCLRMMPLPGDDLRNKRGSGEARVLTNLYGGQGTINVNSWSPDSRRFAFVRYSR